MPKANLSTEHLFEKLDQLLPKICELDKKRWSGEEMRRGHLLKAKQLLFDNTSGLAAEERLTAHWYCCILDRGYDYRSVWDKGLEEVLKYIKDGGKPPQLRYSEKRYFVASCKAFGGRRVGLFAWLSNRVLAEKTTGKGSIYRVVGFAGKELLKLKGPQVKSLCEGKVGLLGNWKRLWMFVMLLRRDRSSLKGLIEEAAAELGPRKQEFLNRWYGDAFPEVECELPVDRRIQGFFEKLGMKSATPHKLARIAHEWGARNSLPPSCLDVAFVDGFKDELADAAIERKLVSQRW